MPIALHDPKSSAHGRGPNAREVLLLCAAFLAARLFAVGSIEPDADALVTLRYARNLASGAGLVFNPSVPWVELPLTGATGQACLVAMLESLGMSVMRAALAWNLAAEVLTIVLLCSLWHGRTLRILCAVLVLAGTPAFAGGSLGLSAGPLLVCGLLWAIWAARIGAFGLAGLLAGLAVSLRPEALLFAPLFLLVEAGRMKGREMVRFLAGFAVTSGSYAVLMLVGLFVPLAELPRLGARTTALPLSDSIVAWTAALPAGTVPALIGLFVVACLGALRLWRERDAMRPLLALGLTLAILDLLSGATHPASRAFVFLFTAALGLASSLEWLARRVPVALPRASLLPAGAALVAVAGWTARAGGDAQALRTGVHEPMAEWARESRFGADSRYLFAPDVSAIGYYGGGVVFDGGGRLWRPSMRARGAFEAIGLLAPEYLLLPAARPVLAELREHEELVRTYYPIRRFSALGETALEPRLDDLPETRGDDYLLYRRRL